MSWRLQADRALQAEVSLRCGAASATWPLPFLEPRPVRPAEYLPAPRPVATEMLVGAHHCPLWEPDQPQMWDNVLKHPERTPALGYYAQNNPEVADWETTWAIEHGISFFIYCWYRSSQGGAVTTRYGSAIHDALFKSRYASQMKFTIMWENQNPGTSGVADERDLLDNLLPYWLDSYFRHPSYLKVDNKPVLFIYRPEFLVRDLGSVAAVNAAFAKMRAACQAKGFDGLWLLGEYRGLDPKRLTLMKELGLDYTFAYVWPVPNSPPPQVASDLQMSYLEKTQEMGILPQVVTVSQAWSGWRDEGSIWKIPPPEFEALLRRAKAFCQGLPEGELGRRLLLLDNWNEWGEGHYLAPYREYGFGYLDAVRRVFAPAAPAHEDLLPEDIGRGPYDQPFRAHGDFRVEMGLVEGVLGQEGTAAQEGHIGVVALFVGVYNLIRGPGRALDVHTGDRLALGIGGGSLHDGEVHATFRHQVDVAVVLPRLQLQAVGQGLVPRVDHGQGDRAALQALEHIAAVAVGDRRGVVAVRDDQHPGQGLLGLGVAHEAVQAGGQSRKDQGQQKQQARDTVTGGHLMHSWWKARIPGCARRG
ncbi:MAG: glycoside hydrolase family 99-like domain-containing protein [Armatimonadetes bacterium]|nr:glycoside hydrolase family 99-like domain-containing protein [Armatimonadota bacterium]